LSVIWRPAAMSLPTSTRLVVLACLAGFAIAGCVYADP
jgi:hypothetical protein